MLKNQAQEMLTNQDGLKVRNKMKICHKNHVGTEEMLHEGHHYLRF